MMLSIPLAGGMAALADDRFLMFVIDGLAHEYERRGQEVVRLTLGKAESPPAAPIVDAMLAAAADYRLASLVFPAGLPHLRERLAEEYSTRYGAQVGPERFIVSTGTSTLFRNLHQLLVEPGHEVVLPLPYYPLYPFTAQLAGARVRHYRIDPTTLRVDLPSLREAITDRTRVVVVNSPGNPLGNIIGPEEFLAMDRIVDGRAVIVSDEIYGNVHFDSDEPYSAAQLMEQLRSPCVVTNAFSKAHRMYARRVGYALVPQALTGPLTVLQHHTLLTTDPVPQFGAIAALDHSGGVQELVERYRARRNYTLKAFHSNDNVVALPSRGGFYLTLDCSAFLRASDLADSLELAEDILRATHVATVPGADFGLPQTLRLSFTAAKYEEAVDRLVGYFESNGNKP